MTGKNGNKKQNYKAPSCTLSPGTAAGSVTIAANAGESVSHQSSLLLLSMATSHKHSVHRQSSNHRHCPPVSIRSVLGWEGRLC